MCGIAGKFLLKDTNYSAMGAHLNALQQTLSSQIHRGPDHQAIETIQTDNGITLLGHNRLSIVDLYASSNQPMWDAERRYCMVYNGMLYNYIEIRSHLMDQGHVFYSQGDTEVVLQAFMAWGVKAFNWFNGMFALAIYDALEETLYLARDRFGVKPLFYHHKNDAIYFASTSAEIAKQLGLQPNIPVLARGLNIWCYDFNADTVYQDLNMVPPGEVLVAHCASSIQLQSHAYYDLSSQIYSIQADQHTVAHAQDQITSLLEDAVKIRLRCDAKMGISLSGGIDSSTIASIAKQQGGELTAYCFGSLQHRYSEAKMADLSAKQLNLPLHYVYPDAVDMLTGFFATLDAQDAPFPNLSIVAQHFVFKLAQQQGIKVMLGGQGGDEIFMGYRKYLLFYMHRLLHNRQYAKAAGLLSWLLPSAILGMKNMKTHWFTIKRYVNANTNMRWQYVANNFNLGIKVSDPLWKRQRQDIYVLSLPTLLRYEDRNSMSNSIESRLPFLDYRLVELALALPESTKINKGFGKWVLRNIAAAHIPKQIAYARVKRGFDVDTDFWIKNGLGAALRQRLKSNSLMLKKMGLLREVDRIFSDHQLCSKPFILAEIITLAWMAAKQHFIWS